MLSSISSTEIANTFGRPAYPREFPSIFLYFLIDSHLPPEPHTQQNSLYYAPNSLDPRSNFRLGARVSTRGFTYFCYSGRMDIRSGLYPFLTRESWAGIQHSRPPFGFRKGSCFSRPTKPYRSASLLLQFLSWGIINERLVRLIPPMPK
ncbi:hypothetical protein HOY80DRAFT_1007196 [Tuber brumale]|nr:hypothetical protein HOY80DRAFT_1007196 [Tuber brumale]